MLTTTKMIRVSRSPLSADRHILVATIDNPSRRNAMSIEGAESLTLLLEECNNDPRVAAVLLAGADNGRRAVFCSGIDLVEVAQSPSRAANASCRLILAARALTSKPLVAVVHGAAIGLGAVLSLHADIIVGTKATSFRFPFANLGLPLVGGSHILLPARVGASRANDSKVTKENKRFLTHAISDAIWHNF